MSPSSISLVLLPHVWCRCFIYLWVNLHARTERAEALWTWDTRTEQKVTLAYRLFKTLCVLTSFQFIHSTTLPDRLNNTHPCTLWTGRLPLTDIEANNHWFTPTENFASLISLTPCMSVDWENPLESNARPSCCTTFKKSYWFIILLLNNSIYIYSLF